MFFVLPPLMKCTSERRLLIAALIFDVAHQTFYAAMSARWQLFVVAPLASLSWLSYPLTSSLLARFSPSDKQGGLQGVLAGVRAFAAGIGPLLFSLSFALFAHNHAVYFPVAPFAIGCVLITTAAFVTMKLPDSREDNDMNQS